jgi:PmbA protein
MYEASLFKTPFDSEGFDSEDLTLVENGTFKSFWHNSVTAKYFDENNNYRAARGARSSLGVSGTNIIIKEGTESSDSLHNGEYLKIYSMQGLHSGLNFMSGDFSFGASGYLMRGDEIVQAVNGITVAGNFYKMLKEIEGIGVS